jgi:hypothetical protein
LPWDIPAIKIATKQFIPAPPIPASSRPTITCGRVCPKPLEEISKTSQHFGLTANWYDSHTMKVLMERKISKTNLPYSASYREEAVRDHDHCFATINVTQLPILQGGQQQKNKPLMFCTLSLLTY